LHSLRFVRDLCNLKRHPYVDRPAGMVKLVGLGADDDLVVGVGVTDESGPAPAFAPVPEVAVGFGRRDTKAGDDSLSAATGCGAPRKRHIGSSELDGAPAAKSTSSNFPPLKADELPRVEADILIVDGVLAVSDQFAAGRSRMPKAAGPCSTRATQSSPGAQQIEEANAEITRMLRAIRKGIAREDGYSSDLEEVRRTIRGTASLQNSPRDRDYCAVRQDLFNIEIARCNRLNVPIHQSHSITAIGQLLDVPANENFRWPFLIGIVKGTKTLKSDCLHMARLA
jgi:hypothetical protein